MTQIQSTTSPPAFKWHRHSCLCSCEHPLPQGHYHPRSGDTYPTYSAPSKTAKQNQSTASHPPASQTHRAAGRTQLSTDYPPESPPPTPSPAAIPSSAESQRAAKSPSAPP